MNDAYILGHMGISYTHACTPTKTDRNNRSDCYVPVLELLASCRTIDLVVVLLLFVSIDLPKTPSKYFKR